MNSEKFNYYKNFSLKKEKLFIPYVIFISYATLFTGSEKHSLSMITLLFLFSIWPINTIEAYQWGVLHQV